MRTIFAAVFRQLIVILLLFAFASAHFQCFVVLAGFELNKKYIAENLCENRDKPWMHCNGKCVLRKKMEQAEKNEAKTEQQSRYQRMQEVVESRTCTENFAGELLAVFDHAPAWTLPQEFPALFFHPPKA